MVPPNVINWFINPMNNIDISPIKHSYWSYLHQLNAILGAPSCRERGFVEPYPILRHTQKYVIPKSFINIQNVEIPLHDRIVNVLKDTHPKGQFQSNHHIEAIWNDIQRSKTNWVRSLDCENTTKKIVLLEYCDQPWDVYISYVFTNSL